jgi:hypothetical protein
MAKLISRATKESFDRGLREWRRILARIPVAPGTVIVGRAFCPPISETGGVKSPPYNFSSLLVWPWFQRERFVNAKSRAWSEIRAIRDIRGSS